MRIGFTLVVIATLSFLFGCDKSEVNVTEGSYKGTFTVTNSTGVSTGAVTLELKNGRFSCSGNSDRIPAGGSGSYSVTNGKIVFVDENFWTADFDWNLILNGRYDYTFDGKILQISTFKNDVGFYRYDLEKQ